MSISVIIPVFNGAPTLAEAVASVRAQAVPSEIIIVDDGSTDDTARVAATLGDVTFVQQPNRGPAAARNTGLAHARTELITFIDDDDLWEPHKLALQCRLLDEHPGAAAVLGLSAFRALHGGTWQTPAPPHLLYHLGASMIRRSAFDRIGVFDPELHASEDVDWFLRLRDAGLPLVVMRDVVQTLRRNGENMTRGKDLRELGFLEVLKRSLDRRRSASA